MKRVKILIQIIVEGSKSINSKFIMHHKYNITKYYIVGRINRPQEEDIHNTTKISIPIYRTTISNIKCAYILQGKIVWNNNISMLKIWNFKHCSATQDPLHSSVNVG